MSTAKSIRLCLVNNDPTSTLLVADDGQPTYSIETNSPQTATNGSGSPTNTRSKIVIKRRKSTHQSTGQVESAVGVVEYCGPDIGTRLELCADNFSLTVVPIANLIAQDSNSATEAIADNLERLENTTPPDNSWKFTGPDNREYKWQILLHSPVLTLCDDMLAPLARYRTAKIGIVSRSRKASLEIYPAGIEIANLIVSTFVAFVKQRLLVEDGPWSITRRDFDEPDPPGIEQTSKENMVHHSLVNTKGETIIT